MATKKSSSKTAKKKKTSASKKVKRTTDIAVKKVKSSKPSTKKKKNSSSKIDAVPVTAGTTQSKSSPASTFTIRQLDDHVPDIEPLMDEVESLEDEIETMHDSDSEKLDISYQPLRKPAMRVSSLDDVDDLNDVDSSSDFDGVSSVSDIENIPPKDIIKVRFGTFVNLVNNHDMEEVLMDNADKEIIMEANLLTELATSEDQREERRVPLVFLVGIALGVVLTYIFFST